MDADLPKMSHECGLQCSEVCRFRRRSDLARACTVGLDLHSGDEISYAANVRHTSVRGTEASLSAEICAQHLHSHCTFSLLGAC